MFSTTCDYCGKNLGFFSREHILELNKNDKTFLIKRASGKMHFCSPQCMNRWVRDMRAADQPQTFSVSSRRPFDYDE